ncbi:MAG TPA: DUF1398 domain-containing protein [Verrucomicrobiae bacterium]|nr:DUF1398 domain-containing protein [Verrucomicrobiae bacterium]
MNTELVKQAAEATLAGTKSFPEIVSMLLEAGVEYYHVDYVGLRKTFYSADGEATVTTIHYEGLPPVAENFDAAALRADILDSQRNNQKYRDFTRRAMQAGVQGYFAFLRGKRVTYLGRQGDQHVEWFPGAGPTKAESQN